MFVITRDGTLRTAPPADGRPTALRGYAQTLVIGAVEWCGIPVDTAGPVRVGDGGGDGGESRMWEEMFVTSSVRLIVPVGRLFVPEYGGESGMVLRTLWTHGGGHRVAGSRYGAGCTGNCCVTICTRRNEGEGRRQRVRTVQQPRCVDVDPFRT